MRIVRFFADANFYLSVIILIYGCVTAITDHYTVFDFNEDLFGAMHNNLRMALLFMGMTEVVVCVYCFATNQPGLMLFVGYFLILMLGSLAFYGKINSVPIDNDIHIFFLYTGISHIIYGVLAGFDQPQAREI